MSKVSEENRVYYEGYNECLNDLEREVLAAAWYDNDDEDVVWKLIQKLRNIHDNPELLEEEMK